MMLKRLGKDDAYEVLQAISDYVLNGVEPSNEGLTGMVIEQVVSVIRRKGQKSWNSKNNLDKANAVKSKKEDTPVPTCDISNDEKEKAKEEVKKETRYYKPTAKLKVDENNGYFQEWLLMMKNNPEDKKTFSRWWQFYRNKDDAVEDLNNRFQIEANYA